MNARITTYKNIQTQIKHASPVAFLDRLRENDWVMRAENIDFCISRPAAKEFLGGMSIRFGTKATMTPPTRVLLRVF
jgi:hypothetical protein